MTRSSSPPGTFAGTSTVSLKLLICFLVSVIQVLFSAAISQRAFSFGPVLLQCAVTCHCGLTISWNVEWLWDYITGWLVKWVDCDCASKVNYWKSVRVWPVLDLYDQCQYYGAKNSDIDISANIHIFFLFQQSHKCDYKHNRQDILLFYTFSS